MCESKTNGISEVALRYSVSHLTSDLSFNRTCKGKTCPLGRAMHVPLPLGFPMPLACTPACHIMYVLLQVLVVLHGSFSCSSLQSGYAAVNTNP
jgi:hypothetical protein